MKRWISRKNICQKKGEILPEILDELERTMCLLAYEDPLKSPFADLLDLSHRRQLGAEVNCAILEAQHMPSRPRIEMLAKLIYWSQEQLDKKRVPYARMVDLSTATLEPTTGGRNNNNNKKPAPPAPQDVHMHES